MTERELSRPHFTERKDMLGFDFWVQLIIVLIALFYGARKGGMALGLIGGIGLLILIFGFGVKVGKPPVDVILTILAVVCGSATLQAAGGLDCLLQIAERVLRKHPRAVVYLAPYICWFLTVLCGTGHVVYTMLPIIYDVAIKNGIRPERPMAASTIAAQMGVICSPAAVAAVSMISLLEGYEVGGKPFGFLQLFAIVIPSAIVGLFAEATFSSFRGKDLDKDEEFQKLISDPEQKKYVYGETTTLVGKVFPKTAWASLYIFLATIAFVAVLGMDPALRPAVGGKPLGMTQLIQMAMLSAGALMVIFCNVRASSINKTAVFNAGMVAIVAVYGVAWMADTMFMAHLGDLKEILFGWVKEAPWTYAIVLLLVSKLVNSQAAAIATIVPVALAVGTPPGLVVAFSSACYGYYILPTYPSDLAALQFDRSGTTHIGRFVINHSFILPGLIGVITATIVGYFLGVAYGYI